EASEGLQNKETPAGSRRPGSCDLPASEDRPLDRYAFRRRAFFRVAFFAVAFLRPPFLRPPRFFRAAIPGFPPYLVAPRPRSPCAVCHRICVCMRRSAPGVTEFEGHRASFVRLFSTHTAVLGPLLRRTVTPRFPLRQGTSPKKTMRWRI